MVIITTRRSRVHDKRQVYGCIIVVTRSWYDDNDDDGCAIGILTLVVLLVFRSAAHLEHDFHVVGGAAAADSAVDVVLGRSGWKSNRKIGQVYETKIKYHMKYHDIRYGNALGVILYTHTQQTRCDIIVGTYYYSFFRPDAFFRPKADVGRSRQVRCYNVMHTSGPGYERVDVLARVKRFPNPPDAPGLGRTSVSNPPRGPCAIDPTAVVKAH